MTEAKVLNEVALNEREINHDAWGSFIICRPTNRINTKIETAVTRAYNRDMQTMDKVPDADSPDGYRRVPAFLTYTSKARLLSDHGEWTEEDIERVKVAEEEYRTTCLELDAAGYVGAAELSKEYQDLEKTLDQILGSKKKKYKKQIEILIPVVNEENASVEDFMKAKSQLDRGVKDLALLPVLDRLSELHKQYSLFLEGARTQGHLFALKLHEITLFTDTIESRSEKDGQLVKIFECVKTLDGDSVWGNLIICEDDTPEKLAWFLQEIERFERLDTSVTEEEERHGQRFNFLFPLGDTSTSLDDSHAQRESSNDGESQLDLQASSSEDSDTQEEN